MVGGGALPKQPDPERERQQGAHERDRQHEPGPRRDGSGRRGQQRREHGRGRHQDSSGRRAQAQATRERILQAARELFVERGYARTSIAEIAAAAGVSSPTVFAGFTSNVNLLKEAVETTLVGDADPVPLHDRPAMRHVHDGPTAGDVLDRLAALIADRAPSVCPIYAVMDAAADADPAIATLARTLDEQRLAGAERLADTVSERLGVSDTGRRDEIRDTIWTLNSPQLHQLLVTRRSWSVQRYEEWIRQALRALAGPEEPVRAP